jgi:hypothetical protein
MDQLRNELERAAWCVAEAKEIVAHQLARVEALRDAEHPGAFSAENTLDIFIGTLKALEDHVRLLRDEIAKRAELRDELLKRRE